MKYMEYPQLSQLSQKLSHEGPECSVHTRIEAYSCKTIKREKRLFKSLENAYADDAAHSPPGPSWLALDPEAEMTPFGPIDKHASRKTLYLLIATLNVAFPDYDFSDVRPAHFSKEKSGASVLNAFSTTLVSPHRAGVNVPRTYSAYPPMSSDFFPSSVPSSSSPYNYIKPSPHAPPPIVSGTHPYLYRTLEEAIGNLSECEVYSYSPDIDSDPHADDLSDGEDDVNLDDDEGSSSDEDQFAFEFDDYDVDEVSRQASGREARPPSSSPTLPWSIPSYGRNKPRGALLWSSHWFFLNRKLKRMLFVTVWARSKSMARSWNAYEEEEAWSASINKSMSGERFYGWEGGVGAGARAMGLKVN